MPVYCITGSNRGLGLEFVRQLAQSPDNTILATARPSASLDDLKAVSSPTTHVLPCDTSSADSITAFADAAAILLGPGKQQIDFLLNNAGVNDGSTSEHGAALDVDHFLNVQVAINVLGPARTVEALQRRGLLSPSVRVLHMSSGLASMARTDAMRPAVKCTGYSMSKAALNMLALHQAADLRARTSPGPALPGAVVVLMDPGWVKTRMGGEGAVLEPEVSIAGMLRVLRGLGDEDNGRFYCYDGSIVPW